MDSPLLSSPNLPTIVQSVQELGLEDPFYCIRPETIVQSTGIFCQKFKGLVLYAVKCNPHPWVLEAVYRGGVRDFEVASLAEIRQVRGQFPQATLHFMHPVKPRGAIRLGYQEYGVRDFAFDDPDELTKIIEATNQAKDLGLFLRIAVPALGAALDLSKRFGLSGDQAVSLLRTARRYSARLGVCFHVGSQCLDPQAFRLALECIARVIDQAGVAVDIVDVGGGFPVSYPTMSPPALECFLEVIHTHTKEYPQIWCEPGRALVAAGGSLIVQVLARRDDLLFINDGIFGGLADAGIPHYFRYPARLIPAVDRRSGEAHLPFSFSGPTCDGYDLMPGPFWLPPEVAEGDWIELGQLGAYSASMRSQFHSFQGFDEIKSILVSDPPLTPGYTDLQAVA